METETTFEVISTYSRSEALADGVLVDVTRQASTAEMMGGFVVPVAVTSALWAAIEAIPERLDGIADVRGRLHDVLWMARLAARRGGSSVGYRVILPYRGSRKQIQALRADIGPGDDGEPVVTIGFPNDF